MSSSFWVGNDAVTSESDTTGRRSTPASKGVIHFADDLEAVLLTSLSANLYSCPGVDLYTRRMIKKTPPQQKELSWTSRDAFVRDGTETHSVVRELATPPPRLQELLPVGHPVRTRVEEMVRASDLPRRLVVRPPCSGEEETMATLPSTTPTSSSSLDDARTVPGDDADGRTRRAPHSGTTPPLLERLQSSEGEEAEENLRDAPHASPIGDVPNDSMCDTGASEAWEAKGPSSIAVPAPPPQSALAKLVAHAKTAIPAAPTRTHSSSDEDEEDEEEGVVTRPFSSRSTAFAASANARRTPSSSSSRASPSIGVKRERSSFLSFPEGEEDSERSPRRREDEDGMDEKNGDSTTLACRSPTEGEDSEGRVKEGGGAEGATENPANAKVLPKHPSQMTREEFLSQFKRAPRRGEIGLSAEEIDHAEALGYVMSGSRSKAAHLFVNRVQRQLHERDAAKRDQQFRQVEDERHDTHLIEALANLVKSKLHSSRTLKKEA